MDRKRSGSSGGSARREMTSGSSCDANSGCSTRRALSPFTEQVIAIIRSIPPGKVMTYGQIAACAGNPRGARQVVRILHAMSGKYGLPWHRVVNAKGEIGLPEGLHREMQLQALEAEGVIILTGGRVDLALHRHEPVALARQDDFSDL